MKKITLTGIALTALLLGGCGYYTQFDNFEHAANLRKGMSQDAVKELMGEPLDVPFAQENVWYYYIETRWHDGQYTIDECLPLVFQNGKLVGWGNEYVNQQKLNKKPYQPPKIEGLK